MGLKVGDCLLHYSSKGNVLQNGFSGGGKQIGDIVV